MDAGWAGSRVCSRLTLLSIAPCYTAVYVINSTLHEPLASAIAGKNCSTTLQEAIRCVGVRGS